MTRLEQVQSRLAPLQKSLLEHPLYGELNDLGALRVFMEHHVFAVWDFMSLLKALQQRLCCANVPWLPAAHYLGARFINEITLAEESDEDGRGGFISHFELYHRAMIRCGADTGVIDEFLLALRNGGSPPAALSASNAPDCVRSFVTRTFQFIECGLCTLTSVFTFGREKLLPGIFRRIVDDLNVKMNGDLADFQYYLHRHIDLDGDHHGPLAERYIDFLCGSDEARWLEVEQAAILALAARQELWDGVYAALRRRREPFR